MKFLVLAACICAAVAAPQRAYQPLQKAAQPFQKAAQVTAQAAQVTAQAAVAVAQPVAKAAYAAAGAAASSSVHGDEYTAEVLRSNSDIRPDGYGWDVETSNGITAQASGSLKKVADQEAVVVQGSYRYIGADGVPVEVVYVADENGFQPQSSILPTPPPVPEAIARSLEYLAAHPPAVE